MWLSSLLADLFIINADDENNKIIIIIVIIIILLPLILLLVIIIIIFIFIIVILSMNQLYKAPVKASFIERLSSTQATVPFSGEAVEGGSGGGGEGAGDEGEATGRDHETRGEGQRHGKQAAAYVTGALRGGVEQVSTL